MLKLVVEPTSNVDNIGYDQNNHRMPGTSHMLDAELDCPQDNN
jgi:hypothetical protein